jgi:hypothetical protein
MLEKVFKLSGRKETELKSNVPCKHILPSTHVYRNELPEFHCTYSIKEDLQAQELMLITYHGSYCEDDAIQYAVDLLRRNQN